MVGNLPSFKSYQLSDSATGWGHSFGDVAVALRAEKEEEKVTTEMMSGSLKI